jgi:hypothetical protein
MCRTDTDDGSSGPGVVPWYSFHAVTPTHRVTMWTWCQTAQPGQCPPVVGLGLTEGVAGAPIPIE